MTFGTTLVDHSKAHVQVWRGLLQHLGTTFILQGELLDLHWTSQTEGQPLSSPCACLFNTLAATLHVWMSPLHPHAEDTSWCLYRDPLIKAHLWLTSWICGPLRALDSLITDAHSSLSKVFCCRLLTFTSRRSFSTFCSHLRLGRLLLASSLLSDIFLTFLRWSILPHVQSVPIFSF